MLSQRVSARLHSLVLGALLCALSLLPARSETLVDAFRDALETNTAIRSALSDVSITRQRIDQARSGLRPTLSASASVTGARSYLDHSDLVENAGFEDRFDLGVNLSQVLYDGGRSSALINQASDLTKAQNQRYRATIHQTLRDVVSVFTATHYQKALLNLHRSNVSLLERHYDATDERFKVGEVTRSDLARTYAELAQSVADVEFALGALARTEADFIRIVGRPPVDHSGPQEGASTYLGLLPPTLEAALRAAEDHSPDLLVARANLDAARNALTSQRAQLAPRFSISGSAAESFDMSDSSSRTTFSVGARVDVPLYAGGQLRASVSEARESLNKQFIQIDSTRALLRSRVTAAFANLDSTRAQRDAVQAQVEAAMTALEGVEEESRFGLKTLLDVLDASQNLLNAQVRQLDVDQQVTNAAFDLIHTMGYLDPRRFGLEPIAYPVESQSETPQRSLFGVVPLP